MVPLQGLTWKRRSTGSYGGLCDGDRYPGNRVGAVAMLPVEGLWYLAAGAAGGGRLSRGHYA